VKHAVLVWLGGSGIPKIIVDVVQKSGEYVITYSIGIAGAYGGQKIAQVRLAHYQQHGLTRLDPAMKAGARRGR